MPAAGFAVDLDARRARPARPRARREPADRACSSPRRPRRPTARRAPRARRRRRRPRRGALGLTRPRQARFTHVIGRAGSRFAQTMDGAIVELGSDPESAARAFVTRCRSVTGDASTSDVRERGELDDRASRSSARSGATKAKARSSTSSPSTPTWSCATRGGPNAGHTLVVGDDKLVVRLMPSGILRPKATCVLAQGMVIDPASSSARSTSSRSAARASRAASSCRDRAHVILPYHVLVDGLREHGRSGPTHRHDQARRRPLLRGQGRAARRPRRRPARSRARRASWRRAALDAWAPDHPRARRQVPDVRRDRRDLAPLAARLVPLLADTSPLVDDAIARRQARALRGRAGHAARLDHGTYPFVTSSTRDRRRRVRRRGRRAVAHRRVVGLVKAYTTRVGGGPFPTELYDDDRRAPPQGGRRVRLGHRPPAPHRLARPARAPLRRARERPRRPRAHQARRPHAASTRCRPASRTPAPRARPRVSDRRLRRGEARLPRLSRLDGGARPGARSSTTPRDGARVPRFRLRRERRPGRPRERRPAPRRDHRPPPPLRLTRATGPEGEVRFATSGRTGASAICLVDCPGDPGPALPRDDDARRAPRRELVGSVGRGGGVRSPRRVQRRVQARPRPRTERLGASPRPRAPALLLTSSPAPRPSWRRARRPPRRLRRRRRPRSPVARRRRCSSGDRSSRSG